MQTYHLSKLTFTMKLCCWTLIRNLWFGIVLLKKYTHKYICTSPGYDIIGMTGLCCSETCIYCSVLILPLEMWKLPLPYAVTHPDTMADAGSCMSPSSLAQMMQSPQFPNRISDFDLSDHRAAFYFSPAILNELGPSRQPCLLFYFMFFFNGRVLTCICRWSD